MDSLAPHTFTHTEGMRHAHSVHAMEIPAGYDSPSQAPDGDVMFA